MNKKLARVLTIIATIVLCVGLTTISFATTPGDLKPTDPGNDSQVYTVGQRIMGVIQAVAIVIAVLVLMVLGIKYMMGSAEEKAEYKKTFIPYIVGAVLVFAAGTIANMVYNFALSIQNGNG